MIACFAFHMQVLLLQQAPTWKHPRFQGLGTVQPVPAAQSHGLNLNSHSGSSSPLGTYTTALASLAYLLQTGQEAFLFQN
jgi:hypothetical protein